MVFQMSSPLGVSEYINWYFDQAGAWSGFIIALILLIIYITKLSNQNITNSLKYWIYSLSLSHLFLAMLACAQVSLLPIIKFLNISIDQAITCKIITIHMGAFVAWYHISVFNVFMEQIYLTCEGSVFAFNKRRFFVVRAIHLIFWLIIATLSAFLSDPSPYNVYKSTIDINNGNTCSAFVSVKLNMNIITLLISIALIILGGYIFAWHVFVYQFTKIIKFTNNKSSIQDAKNDEFYRVIRERTLILSLQVISTVICYIIQMTGFLGQLSVTLDFLLTPIILFLGFKWNRYYFELLKCDKLAICCCGKFEKRMLVKLSKVTKPPIRATVTTVRENKYREISKETTKRLSTAQQLSPEASVTETASVNTHQELSRETTHRASRSITRQSSLTTMVMEANGINSDCEINVDDIEIFEMVARLQTDTVSSIEGDL